MTPLKSFIIILTVLSANNLFAQAKNPEQQLKNYLQQLKQNEIDTIIIVKSGCTGCEVRYKGTSKAVTNGQTIYVLIRHNGQYISTRFDDIHKSEVDTINTCSLFDFINHNKEILGQKAKFYKNEIPKIKSKSGFYPPIPIHHSFEELNIYLPTFSYTFETVDNDKDQFGLKRDKEKWFIVTKEIIKGVLNYSRSVDD